jgi:hypothetical protein
LAGRSPKTSSFAYVLRAGLPDILIVRQSGNNSDKTGVACPSARWSILERAW